MAVWYELWTLDTGNMVADYDTEAEALAEVRASLNAYGREAIAHWALARNGDEPGDFLRIADGSDLAEHALMLQEHAT